MNDYAVAVWIRDQQPIGIEFKAHDDFDAINHARTWATQQGFRRMRKSDPIRADGKMVAGYWGEGQERAAYIQVNRT